LAVTQEWIEGWRAGRRPSSEEHSQWLELLQALNWQGGNPFAAPAEVLVAQIAALVDIPGPADVRTRRLSLTLSGLLAEDIYFADDSVSSREERDSAFETVLRQRVRVGLDQLQIRLTSGWRRGVHTATVVVSLLAGLVIAAGMGVSGSEMLRLTTIGAVLGGPIAWVLRDVAAAIEKLRR
jgi:hypothetical protein